jgi:hypothetical protein
MDFQYFDLIKTALISKYDFNAEKQLVLSIFMCDKSQPLQTLEREGWK